MFYLLRVHCTYCFATDLSRLKALMSVSAYVVPSHLHSYGARAKDASVAGCAPSLKLPQRADPTGGTPLADPRPANPRPSPSPHPKGHQESDSEGALSAHEGSGLPEGRNDWLDKEYTLTRQLTLRLPGTSVTAAP